MENNANFNSTMMCKKNCGFFGNSALEGYCSKCYKDHVKRQNSGSANGRVTPTTGLTSSSSSSVISSSIQSQNIINEIPVNTSNQLSSIGEQMIATSTSSSSSSSCSTSNSTTTTNTPILSTQLSSSSTSIPIPIPSKPLRNNNNNEDNASAIDMGMSAPSDLLATSATQLSASIDESGTSMGTSIGSEKKKRSRCVLDSCKRKVGLTGFDCRCGGLYCWEHRYSDKHNCKFDYKELGQDQIRKNNPIVVGEKIQKI